MIPIGNPKASQRLEKYTPANKEIANTGVKFGKWGRKRLITATESNTNATKFLDRAMIVLGSFKPDFNTDLKESQENELKSGFSDRFDPEILSSIFIYGKKSGNSHRRNKPSTK